MDVPLKRAGVVNSDNSAGAAAREILSLSLLHLIKNNLEIHLKF